jgi:hypothetical protein
VTFTYQFMCIIIRLLAHLKKKLCSLLEGPRQMMVLWLATRLVFKKYLVRAQLGGDVISEDYPSWLCSGWQGIPYPVTSSCRLKVGNDVGAPWSWLVLLHTPMACSIKGGLGSWPGLPHRLRTGSPAPQTQSGQ